MSNKMKEYQEFTRTTAIYPKDKALEYLTLGLCSESGEVCAALKRQIRGDEIDLKKQVLAELGDVVWYITRLADELDTDLEKIMDANEAKLKDRQARNVLKGSGDNR
jgi:NTP pyrophosphatase (non-canonical NTP hydrolase)